MCRPVCSRAQSDLHAPYECIPLLHPVTTHLDRRTRVCTPIADEQLSAYEQFLQLLCKLLDDSIRRLGALVPTVRYRMYAAAYQSRTRAS